MEICLYGFLGVGIALAIYLFYSIIRDTNELCDYIQESAKKWIKIREGKEK